MRHEEKLMMTPSTFYDNGDRPSGFGASFGNGQGAGGPFYVGKLAGITKGLQGPAPAPKPVNPQLTATLNAIKDPPGTPPVVTLPAHMTTPSATATPAATAQAVANASKPSVPLHAAALGAVGTGVGWAVAGPVGGAVGAGAGGLLGALVAKVREAMRA